MEVLEIIGAVWLGLSAIAIVFAWRAKDGYEDERGFHVGRDPRLSNMKDWQDDTPKTERRYGWEFTLFAVVSLAALARWLRS